MTLVLGGVTFRRYVKELQDRARHSRLSAEHARRHLELLAGVSYRLAAMLDAYEAPLIELLDLFVPAFADWCAIDLADLHNDGTLRRHATRHIDPVVDAGTAALHARFPGWAVQVGRVVGGGPSELDHDVRTDPAPGAPVSAPLALSRALGLVSVMVIPIRVRGLSFGALTFGTGPGRRGYRPSDLAVAEDLATRTAIAVERVLLYRENRDAASAATRQTAQLHRLTEAALAITTPMSREEVLRVLVDQARVVLPADRAEVMLDGEAGTEPSFLLSRPPDSESDIGVEHTCSTRFRALVHDRKEPVREDDDPQLGAVLAVPLTASDATVRGVLLVSGRGEGGFTDDDEAILSSMVHMAWVALENAELYRTAERNERELQALVDTVPLAIVDLDASGHVRRWNRAAEELLGPTGGNGHPSFHDATARTLAELSERVLVGTPVAHVECELSRHDGEAVPTSISAVALAERNGGSKGTLLVVADVTERKRLEERLLHSQRQEAVGQLAGGIAHDFNNLLTVVLGYTELLLARADLGEHSVRDLQAIRAAGEQAARLTSQLLTLSSRQVVQPVVTDANQVIRSIEEVVRRVIPEHIEMRTELASVGGVFIDPGFLEQVVLNLVLNARDAMPDGGELVVRTEDVTLADPVPAVDSDVPPGHYVCLSVRDTGTGMDGPTLERCFEPFFSTKPDSVSSGLGLATVFGIARQADGHVMVDTAPGRGTTFRLLFPYTTAPPEQEPAGSRAPAGRGSERVLVVEDDAEVRSLIREVLIGHGYAVEVAPSGPAALELFQADARAFDLLVTDVVMPDMSGLALAGSLAELHPEARVLFVSGYTAEARENLSALSRRGQFLAKPFTAEELVRQVRHVLDGAATVQGSNR